MNAEDIKMIKGYREIPMHNFSVLFDAIDDCLNEIDRLNKTIEKLVLIHRDYVEAMKERDLNT